MIRIDDDYSQYHIDDDPHYPGGKAKPTSEPNRIDGTPWRALFFNTILGFFQALIMCAYDAFIVSGDPDNADDSDLLDAIIQIMVNTLNTQVAPDRATITNILKELDLRLQDSPKNNNAYGRKNGAWESVIPGTRQELEIIIQTLSTFLTDAPLDGKTYGRKNGVWAEASGGGAAGDADAIKSLKFYSTRTLMNTNTDTALRRARNWDIGLLYLSQSSEVYHFDTDFFNQAGASNITIQYNGEAPRLVGKDDDNGQIGLSPAISDAPPYEPDGKSIYGNFSILKTLAQTNNCTVEFWARFPAVENIAVFGLGSSDDFLAFNTGGADPEYSTPDEGDPPYSFSPDDIPYSVAIVSENTVTHSWQGGSEEIDLSDLGVYIALNTWIHIAAVLTPEKISLFIAGANVEFNRNSETAQTQSLEINSDEEEFNLDELMIDETAALSFDTFLENTEKRIPWAALNYQEPWFVLEAEDVTKVKTNLFQTDEFRAAVEAVINNQN
jgi:hypothetical protein